MLVDPKFNPLPTDAQIAEMVARSGLTEPEVRAYVTAGIPERLHAGVYEIPGFNFHLAMERDRTNGRRFEMDYPTWPMHEPWLNAYGVCDSPAQFLEHYKGVIHSDLRYYCVAFTRLDRKDQSADGGWRWHKWGPYIGTQKPQHEYLYDDTHIDTVWVYHVYELTKDEIA